jgi:hypothetical protein
MKKFIYTALSFILFSLLFLEVIIRITHFYNDVPTRFFDKYNVEKWQANQEGQYYTGNKKEFIAQYRINNFGFNSPINFDFINNDTSIIAVIGDSYIEGFNQNVDSSLGSMVMNEIPVKCYEMGYSGYDLASIVHLLNAYKNEFKNINHVYISVNNSDFNRSNYEVTESQKRRVNSPLATVYRNIKLLMFLKRRDLLKLPKRKRTIEKKTTPNYSREVEKGIALLKNIDYLKDKVTFLMDSEHLDSSIVAIFSQYDVIDYSDKMKESKYATTFGFDKHWNAQGRKIISKTIISDVSEKLQTEVNQKKEE